MADTVTKIPEVEIKVEHGAPEDESQTIKLTPESIDNFAHLLIDPDSPEVYYVIIPGNGLRTDTRQPIQRSQIVPALDGGE